LSCKSIEDVTDAETNIVVSSIEDRVDVRWAGISTGSERVMGVDGYRRDLCTMKICEYSEYIHFKREALEQSTRLRSECTKKAIHAEFEFVGSN
jgi:hypothetical protein